MNRLDARLQAVLNLIPPGSILLDVGTDHCKLPVAGLESGRLQQAFASDIKQGPLNAAAKQLAAVGLTEQVPLYLSAGLEQIPAPVLEQVTVAAVAGMGGEVMEVILKQAPCQPPLWVLQPMSAVYELLDTLAAGGYEVVDAALALEGDKLYRAFAVKPGGAPYTADYFKMHRKDPLYSLLLQKEGERVRVALAGLQAAKNPSPERVAHLESLYHQIRKAMNHDGTDDL